MTNKFKLTDHEIDILAMLARGFSYIEVMNTMYISNQADERPDCLSRDMTSIKEKTNSETNMEAIYNCNLIIKNRLR
jgi:hypothetical protein